MHTLYYYAQVITLLKTLLFMLSPEGAWGPRQGERAGGLVLKYNH